MISGLESVFPTPEVLQALLKRTGGDQKVYLVGGVVRDLLLGIANHDLDLAVSGDVRRLARGVADEIGGAFYMMDLEHQTARIVLPSANGNPYYLDFAALRGGIIETDLIARDFTVNAMAIDLANPDQIIDPLGGAQNLKDHVLRACRTTAFTDDPVRLLRAVRHSAAYNLRIEPETIRWLKTAAPLLSTASIERQRDEFFRILEGQQVAAAVRILDQFGLLEQLVPEVREMKTTKQSGPHPLDAWEHTLATLGWLERLLGLLVMEYHEEKANNLLLGMATVQLGRFRERFSDHFNSSLTPGRTIHGLVCLAVLLHDIGKPKTTTTDTEGRTHFYEHEKLGAELTEARVRALGFSNREIDRVRLLVLQHMRIHQLATTGREVSRRSIYRYFRDTGQAGIDLCILSLADTLATYGVTISSASWEHELRICRQLLDAWFDQNPQVINLPQLVNGSDLIRQFQLEPGPLIGKLLAEIHEAQATGQINSIEDALDFAEQMINRYTDKEERSHDGA